MSNRENETVIAQGTHGKWAVYSSQGRVSRFFNSHAEAVKEAARQGK